MAAGKTVVRIRLASPELSKALSARGVRGFSGELNGTLFQNGEVAQTFQYPVTASLASGASFSYSFLRAIKPGTYRVKLVFTDPGGGHVAGRRRGGDLGPGGERRVPPRDGARGGEHASGRRGDRHRGRRGGEPGEDRRAAAEDSAARPRDAGRAPPSRSGGPAPPIRKVEFYLDEKLIVTRTRPPYSVEIDLGNVPRRQTLRAVGYDESGRGDRRGRLGGQRGQRAHRRARATPARSGEGKVRIKVAVQSISGGVAKKVELFLDEKKIGSWTSPPYETTDSLRAVRTRELPPRHRGRRGRQGSRTTCGC